MGIRLMTVNAAAGNSPLALFPNGADFALTDVFLGAGYMEFIEIDNDATAAIVGVMNVYDAVVNSTNRFRIGGTTGHTPADLWRLITGQTVVKTEQSEPYTIGALNAEVTNLRRVLTNVPINIPVSTTRRFEIGHHFKGMVVTVTSATSVFAIRVGYQPQQSGFSRRRQFYKRSVQGVSTGTAAGTLTDSGATWLTNQFLSPAAGQFYRVTSNGKFAAIASNTGTVLTIDSWVGGTPTSGQPYSIDLRQQPAMINTPVL